ncbi:MAG: dockerin type I domain-containing protein [Oscillospiraceae bacterium]|nr:dockerin type I domain-containing protein [Oscillospiraceae bacterium]
MKKAISVLAAGVMALSSLPVLGVSAEETYALGDVDMDGIVTGHDTAMVSRYVLDDTYTLTEEQLQLADVNGDGEVNQADADTLYNEMQEYVLGNAIGIEEGLSFLTVRNSVQIMEHYAKQCVNQDDGWTQVQKNLADVNLDGVVNVDDVYATLKMYARQSAALTVFENEGQYYIDSINIVRVDDIMDAVINGEEHDTAYIDENGHGFYNG